MGYDLFLDVQNPEVRDRNRGVVLLNIYEDMNRGGRLDGAAVAAILGYFQQIPTDEKLGALEYFNALAKHNGYLGSVTEH